MNAELYGGPEPPSPATILDYRRTKRPPPFERLAAVRASWGLAGRPAFVWHVLLAERRWMKPLEAHEPPHCICRSNHDAERRSDTDLMYLLQLFRVVICKARASPSLAIALCAGTGADAGGHETGGSQEREFHEGDAVLFPIGPTQQRAASSHFSSAFGAAPHDASLPTRASSAVQSLCCSAAAGPFRPTACRGWLPSYRHGAECCSGQMRWGAAA